MWLSTLADIYETSGPYATVYFEPGDADQDAVKQVPLRWRALAEQLRGDGADEKTLAVLGNHLEETTPGTVATHGLVMVAANGELLHADELRGPVGGDQAALAPLPHLAPAVRANADVSRQLVAVIDRTGAEVRIRDVTGTSSYHVVGDDHPLHKPRGGGWSHRRIHSRVEETVERNVAHIAHEIGRLATGMRPSAIVLAGEVQAREGVHRRLNADLQPLVSVTTRGGRSPEDDTYLESAVRKIAAETEQSRRRELAGRLADGLGTGTTVSGLPDVLFALRQGAADVLLFGVDQSGDGRPAAGADTPVAIGPRAVDVAPSMDELRALPTPDGSGPRSLTYDRADAAVVRAGAATDARAEVVPAGEIELTDGIGAILRFAIPAAPCR